MIYKTDLIFIQYDLSDWAHTLIRKEFTEFKLESCFPADLKRTASLFLATAGISPPSVHQKVCRFSMFYIDVLYCLWSLQRIFKVLFEWVILVLGRHPDHSPSCSVTQFFQMANAKNSAGGCTCLPFHILIGHCPPGTTQSFKNGFALVLANVCPNFATGLQRALLLSWSTMWSVGAYKDSFVAF